MWYDGPYGCWSLLTHTCSWYRHAPSAVWGVTPFRWLYSCKYLLSTIGGRCCCCWAAHRCFSATYDPSRRVIDLVTPNKCSVMSRMRMIHRPFSHVFSRTFFWLLRYHARQVPKCAHCSFCSVLCLTFRVLCSRWSCLVVWKGPFVSWICWNMCNWPVSGIGMYFLRYAA